MRSKSTFGIHFIIRHLKNDDKNEALIYARISVNRRRTEISIKNKISAKNWDALKGKAKGKSPEIVKLNHHLEVVRSQITDIYQNLIQEKKDISIEIIKSKFLGEEPKEDSITLIDVIDYHQQYEGNKLSEGTMKNYRTTERYIKKFLQKKYGNLNFLIENLNYKFLVDFELFLKNYSPTTHQKSLNNNGIMKHMERLRKMVGLSVKMDWLEKDPFFKYKFHFDKVERGHLTKAELSILANKSFSIERLQSVLDMFLFSCYTGLAYIDIYNLNSSNIYKGINEKDWLLINRQKTTTTARIPLIKEALELITKYENHPVVLNSEKLFPVISNQRMNGYLKEIAEICGINKNLTFHLARHTFATTVTLSNGVPIESVSKMLGHTSIKTTQIYAKVIEQKLSEDMEKLELRLEKQNTL